MNYLSLNPAKEPPPSTTSDNIPTADKAPTLADLLTRPQQDDVDFHIYCAKYLGLPTEKINPTLDTPAQNSPNNQNFTRVDSPSTSASDDSGLGGSVVYTNSGSISSCSPNSTVNKQGEQEGEGQSQSPDLAAIGSNQSSPEHIQSKSNFDGVMGGESDQINVQKNNQVKQKQIMKIQSEGANPVPCNTEGIYLHDDLSSMTTLTYCPDADKLFPSIPFVESCCTDFEEDKNFQGFVPGRKSKLRKLRNQNDTKDCEQQRKNLNQEKVYDEIHVAKKARVSVSEGSSSPEDGATCSFSTKTFSDTDSLNGGKLDRRKRFLRTREALEKSGLLEITMKTANLLKLNQNLWSEINHLKADTQKLCKSVLKNPENQNFRHFFNAHKKQGAL